MWLRCCEWDSEGSEGSERLLTSWRDQHVFQNEFKKITQESNLRRYLEDASNDFES